jgi:hypothetical protein
MQQSPSQVKGEGLKINIWPARPQMMGNPFPQGFAGSNPACCTNNHVKVPFFIAF